MMIASKLNSKTFTAWELLSIRMTVAPKQMKCFSQASALVASIRRSPALWQMYYIELFASAHTCHVFAESRVLRRPFSLNNR